MLVFGGFLVAFGALLPAVMMLPLGGAAEWTWKFILRKVVGLALLLLVLYGGLRWWKTYGRAKPFRYNTYKEQGEWGVMVNQTPDEGCLSRATIGREGTSLAIWQKSSIQ